MEENTTILHSLQTKVDRLEILNKELEEKLLKQNENIERLLSANLNFNKQIVPVENQEQEQFLHQSDDLEQVSFNHESSTKKEEANKITNDKSIHSLPLVNILGMENTKTG